MGLFKRFKKKINSPNTSTIKEARYINGMRITSGGGGGATYTAGDNIEINSSNVIKAKDVVTINTSQNITGAKTFNAVVQCRNGSSFCEIAPTGAIYTTNSIYAKLDIETLQYLKAHDILVKGGELCVQSGSEVDFSQATTIDLGIGCKVSNTGTSTTMLPHYLTINGVEYTISIHDLLEIIQGFNTLKYQKLVNDHGTLKWVDVEPARTDGLKLTSQQDNSTIGYTITGSLPSIQIQISTDGITWTNWNGSNITLNNGEFRYIRNTANSLGTGHTNTFHFTMTGLISASGNMNSMINYASVNDFCYYQTFEGCTSLTSIPELPSTTLADYCYFNMFQGCSSLTSLTSLPITTLADYCCAGMFAVCSNLKVNENGSTGTTIFTCPDTTGLTSSVSGMFTYTGGTFTGTPTTTNTYKWY